MDLSLWPSVCHYRYTISMILSSEINRQTGIYLFVQNAATSNRCPVGIFNIVHRFTSESEKINKYRTCAHSSRIDTAEAALMLIICLDKFEFVSYSSRLSNV